MIRVLVLALLTTFSISLYAQQADVLLFRKADSVAALYPGHSLYQLNELADKLTSPFASDLGKFRAIYTWVCTNIASDYHHFQKSKYGRPKPGTDPQKVRQWNAEFTADVFRTLLRQHKTVCTGYAYLVRVMSELAGIRCVMVNGYARTASSPHLSITDPNHTWNAVWLNGKWELCDPTWSSGRLDGAGGSFIADYNDAYFLPDPAVFIQNHYPVDTAWLLVDEKPTLAEFFNQPLVYAPAYEFGISNLSPALFTHSVSRQESVDFQFTSTASIADVSIRVGDAKPISLVCQQSQTGYQVRYIFHSRGSRIVHLLVNGKPTVTYRMVVE